MAFAEKAPEPPIMTIAEFLDWDGGGHQGKLILVAGEVVAMAPASATHAVIQANLATALNNHLRAAGSKCRVGTETPVIPPFAMNRNVRAPDLAVSCLPPSNSKVFEDPILIIEVMSPTNRRETEDSVARLAGLDSLREIVLVESEMVSVQVVRRNEDGTWPESANAVASEASAAVRLASVDLELPVAEIYRMTHLVG